MWETPKIRGISCWGACNKDPTIQGTILGFLFRKLPCGERIGGGRTLVRLCNLKKGEGDVAVEEIYKAKHELRDALLQNSPEPPFILKHPDLPGCKAGRVQQNFHSVHRKTHDFDPCARP